MATRDDLCDWVIEALGANGGSARIVEICKFIWQHYENELRQSGDLFFTWQYDVRWAGQQLRDSGILLPASGNRKTPWQMNYPAASGRGIPQRTVFLSPQAAGNKTPRD